MNINTLAGFDAAAGGFDAKVTFAGTLASHISTVTILVVATTSRKGSVNGAKFKSKSLDISKLYQWPKGEPSHFDDDGAFIRV